MKDLYIITVKVKRDSVKHDPKFKITAHCLYSSLCTDATGAHHSFVGDLDDVEQLKRDGVHITRTERLDRPMS